MKKLLLLSLFIVFYTLLNAQQYVPKRYWTFNTATTSPIPDSTGNGTLNLTAYGGQYTIQNNGPVKKYVDLNSNSGLVTGGALTLNQGVTIEFLMKPGTNFEFSKMFQRGDGAFYIAFDYPRIIFQTAAGSLNDEFVVTLDGIGRKSYNYYVDGNWHHVVFKYNASTGLKQIWVDGQLPIGFSKTIATGSYNNSTGDIFLGSTVGYVQYYGALDECAIYDVAIPDKLIYKHYLNFQAGQSYSYLDDYTGTIPTASPVSAPIDLQEFAPGHVAGQLTNGTSSGVSLLPTTQMQKFPDPRYKPNHTLMRNYNWMDTDYMAGQFQSWNTSNLQTGTYGTELQTELAKNFNYYFNINLWQSTDPRFTIPRDYLNANTNVPIAITILRAQINGNNPDLKSQTKPNSYYLQNSSGQFLSESGTIITSNKVWRPTAPANGYTADGNHILNGLNGLTTLNRNIAIINENAEIFPHISNAAMALDPAVVADKNSTGLSWELYLGQRVKDNETQSYRNIFMAHPKMAGGIFTEYAIGGQPQYQPDYATKRFINYPINGQYYSTSDFYVRWPNNWRYWVSAWHGWQWMVESRHVEIGLGDKYCSPFVSAGWDPNEESNVRPSQWLGLLKNQTAFGAEFFYTGFFNLNAPWPDSRNWIWQSVMPSYAQAITSKAEVLFKNSNVMTGDIPASYINPANPGYQFKTGDKSKLVVIRKHNTQNEYYITAGINPYSNMNGAAPNVSPATITLDGNNITFNVRRQGSVYVYNSTTNVFYQLDGWHETGHPYNWSTNFELEGELADKGNITIRTEPVVNKNFTNFTSHVTFTDTISYRINVREVGNYTVYVKSKNLIPGITSELKVILDNTTPKIIGCINDTTWKWYVKEKGTTNNITFSNLSVGVHTLYFVTNNSNLSIDKILLTKSVPSVSPLITIACTPSPVATITANGPTTFCQGGTVTLTASNGNSYLWSNGLTTQGIVANASGNYSCTVTTSGVPSTSNTISITVNPLPTATISSSGPTTFCQGGSVTLTSSSGTSYLWSNGATTQSISVNASGNYSVTVTNSNGCSKTSNATTITVNVIPTATISASGPTTFCQGGSVTLTASSGTSYLWSNGATTQSVNVTTSGNYSVTVTSNGCSKVSNVTIVTVNSVPTATISASGPTTFCQGSSVTLTTSSGASYLWSNGATTQSINVNASGNYSVTVTNNGCSQTSSITTVVVNPLPIVSITTSGSTSLCDGQSVDLISSSASSYLWNTGATTQSISVSTSGSYLVTVTNQFGCTIQSLSLPIVVNPIPSANITVNGNTTICVGQTVELVSDLNNQYLWNTGETTQSIIVSATGNYSVSVSNQFGCTANSAPVNITVNPLPNTTVNPAGPISICTGTTATLTASGADSYVWNNVLTSNPITVANSGNYFVVGTDLNGCSSQSNVVSVTVNNCNTCVVPSTLTTTNISQTSATITWSAIPNATLGYTIRLRNVSTSSVSYINVTTNSFNLTSLTPNTKYRWSVRSKCGATNSSYATNKTFRTLNTTAVRVEDVVVTEMPPATPNCTVDDFDLFPNPATHSVSVCFKSSASSNVQIIFYNIAGQNVFIHNMMSQKGINSTTLDISLLLPGMYNVRIVSDSFMYSKPLTIIK